MFCFTVQASTLSICGATGDAFCQRLPAHLQRPSGSVRVLPVRSHLCKNPPVWTKIDFESSSCGSVQFSLGSCDIGGTLGALNNFEGKVGHSMFDGRGKGGIAEC